MTDGVVICNSVPIYYRKYGDGNPLVFLHGNGEDGTLFITAAERLSEYFSVYLVDSRGHGRSGNAPLGYENMADDMYGLITQLSLQKPAVYGFSDGGIVALLLAMRHPGLLSKLAVSGVNLNPKALKRRVRAAFRFAYFFTRNNKLKLMLREPDIRTGDLEKITEPVLVLAGEKDIVPLNHTKQIAAAIQQSRCEILRGENHSSYVENNGKLYDCLKEFLFGDCGGTT